MAITAIKGFNDILPGEVEVWQKIESTARRVFSLYGFSEIRVPVMEKTELFNRSIGDATDIVEKEMYTFIDKGENSITLRPEGTAGVMRAFIENKLHAVDSVNKLYYMGQMFRYERPQKGRYRQFHQIGAEVVGVNDCMIDAQVLMMLSHLFRELGLEEPRLMINSLGCPACRPQYREKLIEFLSLRAESLCEDCRRRMNTNPLRVLDCKVEGCKSATAGVPAMIDHLCADCSNHFEGTRSYLDKSSAKYSIDPRMVRGLDYYTRTTFEMVTTLLGSQSAVAAGGRYDGLISDLGGPALPGIGFAMGVERVALLLKGEKSAERLPLFIAALGDAAREMAFILMSDIQQKGFRVEVDYEGKSLKSQMRRADKLASEFVLIIGESELESGNAMLKKMKTGDQSNVPLDSASIISAINF